MNDELLDALEDLQKASLDLTAKCEATIALCQKYIRHE